MPMKQILQGCACLVAGLWMASSTAQQRQCSSLPHEEQIYARAAGTCVDAAPIVDVAPKGPVATIAVANVVGLGWDEARARLGQFTVQRSYRSSAEPGGTVLSQQPLAPARLAPRAIVRLVISDGTLRPPPAVPSSQIDGVRAPTVSEQTRPPYAAASPHTRAPDGQNSPNTDVGRRARPDVATQSKSPAPVEHLRVPNVIGLSIEDAQTRLGRFQIERTDRYSQAPVGRVIAQTPRASARSAAGQPVALIVSRGPESTVTETYELPNLVNRTYGNASGALAEFTIHRTDVAHAAAPGTVLAQDPAPGTYVAAGSAVALQISDGSLAPAAAPVVPAPRAADAAQTGNPMSAPRFRIAVPLSNTVLTIGAAIFLGLVLVTLMVRQWLGRRRGEVTIETAAQTDLAAVVSTVPTPVPEIRFAAQFEPGDVTIEFSGSSDPEQATRELSSAHNE